MGTESKFKAGDKVRCISNEGSSLYTVGKKYTVESVKEYGCGDVLIYCDGVGSGMWPSRFELVSPVWVPKVGDRVEVAKHLNGYGDSIRLGLAVGTVATIVRAFEYGGWILEGDNDFFYTTACLKPATLTIEPGKFYKTRDGRKVGPLLVWDSSFEGELLYISSVDGMEKPFNPDGKHHFKDVNLDLIAEWQEPAVSAPVSAQVDALAEEYGPAKVANDNGPKFKAGDRVVCLKSYPSQFTEGKTYVVSRDFKGGKHESVSVERDDNGSTKNGWCPEFFKLIEPALTPAIVALIENGTPLPATSPKVHATEGEATAEALRLANLHKGQKFGVFVLADTAEVAKPVYEHKWQNLAADGQKINAIKALKDLTGLQLKPAKDAVEYFIQYAA